MLTSRVLLSLTNRKNSDNAVDSDAHDAFSLFGVSLAANQLDANVDGGLLTKPHDLRACSPVPAYQGFVCSRRDKIFRGKRNGANAIQVPGKLL